jgi:hypothetical protein
VQKCPEVHMKDFVGGYNYLLGDLKAAGQEQVNINALYFHCFTDFLSFHRWIRHTLTSREPLLKFASFHLDPTQYIQDIVQQRITPEMYFSMVPQDVEKQC